MSVVAQMHFNRGLSVELEDRDLKKTVVPKVLRTAKES